MSEAPCVGRDWDPIVGASAFSALGSVLAGFVITCIAIVAINRDHRGRANTMVLFLAAFFCLVAATYTEALTAGEVVCMRGWTSTMFGGAQIGVGAATIFCGVAWLFSGYDGATEAPDRHRLLVRFTTASAYSATVIIALMLTVSAQGYLLEVKVTNEVPHWLQWTPWIHLILTLAAIVMLILSKKPRDPERYVGSAASLVLAFGVVGVIAMSQVTNRPAAGWKSIPDFVTLVATIFPLVTASTVLIVLLAALPKPNSSATKD